MLSELERNIVDLVEKNEVPFNMVAAFFHLTPEALQTLLDENEEFNSSYRYSVASNWLSQDAGKRKSFAAEFYKDILMHSKKTLEDAADGR